MPILTSGNKMLSILSSKLDVQVNQKPTNFHALPDSEDPQLKNTQAGRPAKTTHGEDLEKGCLLARAGSGLHRDIAVPKAERKGRRTSLACRFLVAIVHGYVGFGRCRYLSEKTIARVARRGLWWVIRAAREAEAAGYLRVDRRDKCNRYYVCERVKYLPKMWVKPSMVRDDEYSILVACVTSYMKFRQGTNEETWPRIQEVADALGVSYHTAARGVAESAAQGLIQKRYRPRRQSSTNEYALTCKGREVTGVFGPKTARPKARALGETTMAKNHSYANKVRNGSLRSVFGLSFDPNMDGDLYKLLVGYGAHKSVARSMAVQWRHDPESVKQAIINSAHRVEASAKQLRRYKLSRWRGTHVSYLVGALNRARREGHKVPASRLARDAEAADESSARAAARSPPSESEFEQRKKEQIRRLLMLPAKPITPYTDAELALINRQRDREAEDELLTRTLAAARRNCHIYTEVADLG
ncbi:hypothetical protein ES703_46158 [subsurface metagenome]